MDRHHHWGHKQSNGGRIFFGAIVVIVGVFLLLKGLFPTVFSAFSLHLTWPVILIIIGIGIGIKTKFRSAAPWILIAIGGINLITHSVYGSLFPRELIWPSLIILFGLLILFKRKKAGHMKFAECQPMFTNGSDVLNIDISFAGRKEIVTSKNFQGGVIRASFAGAEINLAGADSQVQPMILELHANFAGIELIVPSHWEVQNEINPTMGSVEDLRMIRTGNTGDTQKLLILRGSCSFGSIELKSY
jgi:hypothetical protein